MEKEKEPESAKLVRELQEFYKLHPHAGRAVSQKVEEIRAEHERVMGQIQADFDKQYEETTVVYLRRELDFIKSLLPTT